MKNKKRAIIIAICTIFSISLLTVLCIKFMPFIFSLKNPDIRSSFEEEIKELGIWGILIVILIQTLQVLIAFIPGEIIELISGLLYGTWGGLLVCLIGNFIGSFFIYLIVKFLSKSKRPILQEKFKQYNFLNNKRKVALYLFVIYLIPGLPKDIITYFVPFLPINFLLFITVTSIARIPSIISSTYSSVSFLDNNYKSLILLTVIVSLIAIIGFIFKDKIINILKKDNDQDNANNSSK